MIASSNIDTSKYSDSSSLRIFPSRGGFRGTSGLLNDTVVHDCTVPLRLFGRNDASQNHRLAVLNAADLPWAEDMERALRSNPAVERLGQIKSTFVSENDRYGRQIRCKFMDKHCTSQNYLLTDAEAVGDGMSAEVLGGLDDIQSNASLKALRLRFECSVYCDEDSQVFLSLRVLNAVLSGASSSKKSQQGAPAAATEVVELDQWPAAKGALAKLPEFQARAFPNERSLALKTSDPQVLACLQALDNQFAAEAAGESVSYMPLVTSSQYGQQARLKFTGRTAHLDDKEVPVASISGPVLIEAGALASLSDRWTIESDAKTGVTCLLSDPVRLRSGGEAARQRDPSAVTAEDVQVAFGNHLFPVLSPEAIKDCVPVKGDGTVGYFERDSRRMKFRLLGDSGSAELRNPPNDHNSASLLLTVDGELRTAIETLDAAAKALLEGSPEAFGAASFDSRDWEEAVKDTSYGGSVRIKCDERTAIFDEAAGQALARAPEVSRGNVVLQPYIYAVKKRDRISSAGMTLKAEVVRISASKRKLEGTVEIFPGMTVNVAA